MVWFVSGTQKNSLVYGQATQFKNSPINYPCPGQHLGGELYHDGTTSVDILPNAY